MDNLSDAGKRANLEYYQVQYAKAVARTVMLDHELSKAELLVDRAGQEMGIEIAAELHRRLIEQRANNEPLYVSAEFYRQLQSQDPSAETIKQKVIDSIVQNNPLLARLMDKRN